MGNPEEDREYKMNCLESISRNSDKIVMTCLDQISQHLDSFGREEIFNYLCHSLCDNLSNWMKQLLRARVQSMSESELKEICSKVDEQNLKNSEQIKV